MSDKKPFYITTTLPYVNADPHIGFALELIQADVIARWKKSQGHEVFFNTGTDEHGQKVLRAAEGEGKDVQKYVDEYSEKFRSLQDQLGLDKETLHFIRTTDDKHIKAAQALWVKCFEKGDIYKKKYKGLYCVGDEAFIKPSDLVNGRCPNHPNLDLEEIEEENYYFKLTNYKDKLLKHASESIIPGQRLPQVKDILDNLDDVSISREKSRLAWGLPVPNDDTQVMYVWFDALTNYISTLDWPDGDNFKKFWEEGETLQLAGKDQVKFQSVIWQAMLISAGIKKTDKIYYHGFINSGGHKMSKSLGNVINPKQLVDRYGIEATRYLLIHHVHPYEDTDITWPMLDEWYTANLVNGIGNLTSRVMKMAQDKLEPAVTEADYEYIDKSEPNDWVKLMGKFRLDQALDQVGVLPVQKIDEFIEQTKPFKNLDENQARLDIQKAVRNLLGIALLLKPFMPETATKIQEAILNNKKPENLFPRLA